MDLKKYQIIDRKEIITFRRRYIEESGKMNCRYCLWTDKDGVLKFGLTNPRQTFAVGISVNDHYEEVVSHLENIISKEQVSVVYRYIPAPPESTGSGVVCEVLPAEIQDTKQFPSDVIEVLRKMLEYIKNQFRVLNL